MKELKPFRMWHFSESWTVNKIALLGVHTEHVTNRVYQGNYKHLFAYIHFSRRLVFSECLCVHYCSVSLPCSPPLCPGPFPEDVLRFHQSLYLVVVYPAHLVLVLLKKRVLFGFSLIYATSFSFLPF